jgi:predicted alpha/beta hydrolase
VGDWAHLDLEYAVAQSDFRHFGHCKSKAGHCAGSAAYELCGAQGISESQILNANPLC